MLSLDMRGFISFPLQARGTEMKPYLFIYSMSRSVAFCVL